MPSAQKRAELAFVLLLMLALPPLGVVLGWVLRQLPPEWVLGIAAWWAVGVLLTITAYIRAQIDLRKSSSPN